MIIDCHAHVCAAPELYQWKSVLMSARGAHGFKPKTFSNDYVRDHPDTKRNLRIMDSVGTDVQFLSPRPFQLMHAERPENWRRLGRSPTTNTSRSRWPRIRRDSREFADCRKRWGNRFLSDFPNWSGA